jgi:hypothetical protein
MYRSTSHDAVGDGLGALTLRVPERGRWALRGYPARVVWRGRVFARSRTWAFPYSGVVAQYREERDSYSRHMFVYADGRVVVDHLDEANPERGRALDHAVKDVVPTLFKAATSWAAEHKKEIAGGALLAIGTYVVAKNWR